MQTTIQERVLALECEDFFSNIASNPALLQKGYELVYKYLSISPQHREQTLLHLLSPKAPVLTLVTRTYPVVYTDSTVNISAQQKLKTIEYLILQILLKQLVLKEQGSRSKNTLDNFLMFLNHFHSNDGFQNWVVYYQKLLEEMIKASSDMVGYVLIQILKNSDDRVSCFSKFILRIVIDNQGQLKISDEESLEIIYYCVKSMAYMNGTEDAEIQQYFQPYEQKILSYIFTSMSKSIRIMKFSLKILTVFAADYQIQLEKELIQKIRDCSKQLILEFINSRVLSAKSEQFQDEDEEEQNNTTLSVIIHQLIELFETLLNAQQLKISQVELFLDVCLPALLLGKGDYMSYNDATDTYLADIQDQSQKNLRNKVVSFFLQLYEGEYPVKGKAKLQAQILRYTLLIETRCEGQQKFGSQIIKFLSSASFPLTMQKEHIVLFQESLTFLLYHLTEEILTSDAKSLEKNKQSLLMNLGKLLETSLPQNFLIKVAYLNLLNKLIKSMDKPVKEAYYGFLCQQCSKITNIGKQKGLLLSICRGIAYVANEVQVTITEQGGNRSISSKSLSNLIQYLLDPNTLQQSSHLILQFLLTLAKKVPHSVPILRQLVNAQVQIHVLSTFLHDGMIADVVIDLLGDIASEELIGYVYGEFLKGFAKEQNFSSLIGRWISKRMINVPETDIRTLIKVYKVQFVSKLVKEYLKVVQQLKLVQQLSPQTISLLNDNIHPSWILPMISCSILRNPQILLLRTVESITYELTSQFEIQNQLLLPYYSLLNEPAFAMNILKAKSAELYEKFVDKLIRYAALFQGPYLKVITSLALLNLCEIDKTKIKSVIELISSYGNSMQSEEWEDDEQNQDSVMDRLFNMKIVNDQVQKQFLQIFGDKVSDMELVNSKVSKITDLIS